MFESNSKYKFLNKINIFLLSLFIFTFPLFFCVQTFEYFEFNKQYLLFLFIPLIIFLFLIKGLILDKKLKFKKTPLDVPIITFLIVYFVSSLLSLDRFSSFFGYYENISDSFFVILFLWLLYLLLNNFNFSRYKLKFIKTLIYSSSILALVYLLSFVGVIGRVFPVLNIFFDKAVNLLGGSYESLSIYISILVMITFAYVYYWGKDIKKKNKKRKLFFFRNSFDHYLLEKFLIFLFLFSLASLASAISFIILLFGSLIYLFVEIKIQGIKFLRWKEKSLFLVLFIVLSSSFLVLTSLRLDYATARIENKINLSSSYQISFASLKNNPIIGTGPSTFIYDFSLYRNKSMNYSEDWLQRYSQPALYLLDILVSAGIAGLIAYLLIISILIDLIIICLNKYINKNNYAYVLPNLVIVIIFILLHFIVNFSLALLFLFWFILSLFISDLEEIGVPGYDKIIITNKNKGKYRFLKILLFLLLLAWFLFIYKVSKMWLEDYFVKQGDEKSFARAANLNTESFEYKVKMSQYYLNKLKLELAKPIKLQDRNNIQDNIDKSLKYSQEARALQPYSVLTNETLGMVYRDIKYLGEGGSIEAINAFEDAINFEPTNPVLYTELGKEYLYIGLPDKAAINFIKALELKNDFHEAKFGLAKVYVAEEKYNDAQIILDELLNIYNDPEIYFEKGRLYYNQGETNKAIENFLEALRLNPQHYDALYGLAIAYEAEGDKYEAQKYMQKALEINPNLDLNK